MDKYYKVKDIQNMLDVSERTIRRYIKDKKLIGSKVGGEWRFTIDQVKKLFNEQEVSKSIAKEASKDVKSFIDGNHKVSDSSVCTIIDLYNKSETELKDIMDKITEISKSVKYKGYKMRFTKDKDVARITVISDIDTIIKIHKVIGRV